MAATRIPRQRSSASGVSSSPNDDSTVDKVQEKAGEKVTLARGEIWLLRIAAATGVIGMLSHGVDLLHELGVL